MPQDGDSGAPLAHSPPEEGLPADPYARHVKAVQKGARQRAEAMLCRATNPPSGLLAAIDAAATFHDLGKLDPDIQNVLRRGRRGKLKWDHIDAGVAHLRKINPMAAWLVRAHHAPGLPQRAEHFDPDGLGRKLRGRRRDDKRQEEHEEQIARTDDRLQQLLETHEAAVGRILIESKGKGHGLPMRLALSCLVDADYTDTAFFDTKRLQPSAPDPRWAERLEALRTYVQRLPTGASSAEGTRNQRRTEFFNACLRSLINDPMVACEGPVGLGKTTAVTAYLIRRARDEKLRRLIIVAPFTNILTQTAGVLRRALVLPGERADQVVVEHHHRADFSHRNDRELAVLWSAPVVLTTAVSFFETLAACDPATLRKLHAVPGSAIFLDEAHAALPTKLWPQNWKWLCEMAERWGCRFVFASGSLARFWEHKDVIDPPVSLPELLPKGQAEVVLGEERHRIHFVRAGKGQVLTVEALIGLVRKAPGPRLVILNTVQNAAVVARAMREDCLDVLHLSTALTPRDREIILKRIEQKLRNHRPPDWTLVATSCMEAGVDLSFRCAFRERFSVASTIQVGGRVNRHGEYTKDGGGTVYDFALEGKWITQHPEASIPAGVLLRFMSEDTLNQSDPAVAVTEAIREELRDRGGLGCNPLLNAEAARDYPEVRERGRVIVADHRFVVIDRQLRELLDNHEPVPFGALLQGSVQLWSRRIRTLGLEPLPGYRDIYFWNDHYDADFLGYMSGVLRNEQFLRDNRAWII